MSGFKDASDANAIQSWVGGFMTRFERLIRARFAAETDARECALYVKALDRVHRKVAVFARLMPGFILPNCALITRIY